MAEPSISERPVAVSILGCLWVAFSGLGIVVSVLGVAMWRLMPYLSTRDPVPPSSGQFPVAFKPVAWVFQHFGTLAIAQAVFYAFCVWAGVQFLRLKPWARTYLEVVTWLGIIFMVAFAAYWSISWVSLTGLATQRSEGPAKVLVHRNR